MTSDESSDPDLVEPVSSPEDPPGSFSELFERVRAVSRRISERVQRLSPDDTQPETPALDSDPSDS